MITKEDFIKNGFIQKQPTYVDTVSYYLDEDEIPDEVNELFSTDRKNGKWRNEYTVKDKSYYIKSWSQTGDEDPEPEDVQTEDTGEWVVFQKGDILIRTGWILGQERLRCVQITTFDYSWTYDKYYCSKELTFKQLIDEYINYCSSIKSYRLMDMNKKLNDLEKEKSNLLKQQRKRMRELRSLLND